MNSSIATERNDGRRRLIMLVKQHPILWNKHQTDYIRNRPLKMVTWEAVAKQMGTSSNQVRRTWENLRDQYRRDLKREINHGYTPKWHFFDEMNFIRDVVNCKDATSDFNDSEMEASEQPQLLNETLDPNKQVSNPQSVPMVMIPNVTQFQPIIMNKQWQTVEVSQRLSSLTETLKINKLESGLKPNPSTQECKSSRGDNTNQQIPSPITKQPCDSSRHMPHESVNDQEEFNMPTKTEPYSDVDIEPTHVFLPPFCHINAVSLPGPSIEVQIYQESDVSTSSHKRTFELPQEPLELPTSTPLKKRKMSVTDVDTKDDDYYFVMSLLPSLREITVNKKFQLRIGIMNLIAKNLEEVCK